jgi:transcriptional regulator with PAS, ATPase and Fis domain
MLQKKIVIISSFKGFTNLVRSVCKELGGEEIDVVEAYKFGALPSLVHQLEDEGCEVLIARESSAACHLRTKTSLPIVGLHIAAFDLLRSMFKVSQSKKTIGYIGFVNEGMHYDFAAFEKILGVKIMRFLYESDSSIDSQISKAVEFDVDAVFTTGFCIAQKVIKYNIPTEVISPSRESIIEGIYRAREILNIRKRDLQNNQELRTIINTVGEGIILIDEKGFIKMLNTVAEKFLNITTPSELIGKSLSQLDLGLSEFEVDKNGIYSPDKVICIGNRQVIISTVAIKIDNYSFGTLIALKDVNEVQELEQNIRKKLWEKGMIAKFVFKDIIGNNKKIHLTVQQAKMYAKSDSTVLITGETGVGKELFAQSIHNISSRKNEPFLGLNCAALPETLLDSELFGYEKGAFTGAEKNGKPGLFELAHNGTIFLDEIAELPLILQSKLLRVLQEKEIKRIGGNRIIPINVRVLAATNRNLAQEVLKGNFRSDLYYRINVLRLHIPPLRERKEDIEPLVNYFLTKRMKLNGKTPPKLPPQIIKILLNYQWPGNVRELENFIERYALFLEFIEDKNKSSDYGDFQVDPSLIVNNLFIENILQVEEPNDNNLEQANENNSESISNIKSTLREAEKEIIVNILNNTDNISKVDLAKNLGISRTTLWRKLRSF